MELLVGIVAGGNGNLPFLRCKLHCVINQIPKDLLQSCRIGSQMDILRGQVKPKGEMFSLDFALINFESISQQTVSVDDFEIELHLALADAGQIKKIVNEPRFQLHIAPDHMQ